MLTPKHKASNASSEASAATTGFPDDCGPSNAALAITGRAEGLGVAVGVGDGAADSPCVGPPCGDTTGGRSGCSVNDTGGVDVGVGIPDIDGVAIRDSRLVLGDAANGASGGVGSPVIDGVAVGVFVGVLVRD